MTYLITYALNLFDLAMTYHWYNQYGIAIEGNPIGRYLLSSNLAIPVKVLGIGACLIALYACIKRKPEYKWVGWLPLTAYSILAVYHIFIASIVF